MRETIGTAPFFVDDKQFQTWYKVIGDVDSGRCPLVIIHGGPGLTHHYMEPHRVLSPRTPIVLYDQLGSGNSSHYRNSPPGFWTLSLFADQLESLLKHLGIYDNYDLLGHSWGGFLAAYFASHRDRPGLRRLVLANAPASIPLMQEGLNILLNNFGPDFAHMIRAHEADRTTHVKEYRAGISRFISTHLCDMEPWPTELLESCAASRQDETVHAELMGERTFQVDGSLKDETNVPRLSNIAAQTLVINSEKDEMHDVAVQPFIDHIPNVQRVKLKDSTHVPMFEEPQSYFQTLSEFLA